ncbi:MAG TPA: HEPN domain-containing protein [candidate division WOR-3 bacterium]|uniref:HEPN domain-containing protein n=1 Tax=candidate division WOR-3 bacterium TaxID=2052148 RepID=A0A7C5HN32_UNCW3|nr:HEPN domain-containing protein [candidate division WOR-3 bacterium]
MREEINKIIEKAERSLKTAKELFNKGDYDFAVSRAYYTMFYMAEAVLMTKGLSFSKHSAVISAFGQHYIKTGIIDKKYHKMFSDAFEIRQIGDYNFLREISEEEALIVVKNAEDFLNEIRRFLNREK